MFCNRCGKMNEPGSLFCEYCGADMIAQIPPGQPARGITPPAYTPYYGPPITSNQKPPRRKKSTAVVLLSVLCILLAAVIVLMATGVTEAIFSPQPTASTESDETISLKTSPPSAAVTIAPTTPPVARKKVINLYSSTDEMSKAVQKYIDLHPDFPCEINPTIIPTTDNLYYPALDQALEAGQVDIYCAEYGSVTKYTQGDMSSYAMPYADLGLNVSDEIGAADIAKYIVDIGTRPSDNAVVGIAYQSTGGAFIYRRSIAKKVWGTDDPSVIASKIGPGWDKFLATAADLKKQGYGIVSGSNDIWHAVENSADKGWIVDGKLYIDPKREAFLDYSRALHDKGYTNNTQDWTTEWYADMAGTGPSPIFGFFGPYWMITYVMSANCGDTSGDWAICQPPSGFFWGGSWVLANKNVARDPVKKAAVTELIDWITLQCDDDSFQYGWANGIFQNFDGLKNAVASCKAMNNSDGKLDFLGGQDMFKEFIPAAKLAIGTNITPYDDAIDNLWRDHVNQYSFGNGTREEALINFKKAVKNQLGFDAW